MAAPATFSKFPDLPYDLRHQIYLLATPPRLVYILESFPVEDEPSDTDEDEALTWMDDEPEAATRAFLDFENRLRHGPLHFNLRLHPDLVYFAENWRERIPQSLFTPTQSTLEEHGFTSSKALYEPWTATPKTPRICIDRLREEPRLAFELARETWFYSETPIPAFLHVCRESREILRRWGYRLAFGTRSHAPRTWFHFERDILYAPQVPDDLEDHSPEHFSSALCAGKWSFGQLDLASLQSVTRLVLPAVRVAPSELEHDDSTLHEITALVKLFPNMRELYLEDWDETNVAEFFFGTAWWKIPKDGEGHLVIDGAYNPRVCIPWEPIDPMGSICWFNPMENFYLGKATGPMPDSLEATLNHTHPNPLTSVLPDAAHHSRVWDRQAAARGLRTRVQAELNRRASRGRTAPEIAYVHTCPELLSRRLLHGRHQFWQDFTHLQKQAHDGELTLELPYPAVQERLFMIDPYKISSETQASMRSRYPHRILRQFLPADKDEYARWFFRGPLIPEPGLSPL
ncbi:unnamed protein product [Clonostachys rosea]|uniref:2EXR domain-containing protein n=1 Tax=Bionectria ochroleuca TaxID=29856 RepID=A0ABY6U9P6_BIOOC|nr:unnamed protein product [Clonostachys rosea]